MSAYGFLFFLLIALWFICGLEVHGLGSSLFLGRKQLLAVFSGFGLCVALTSRLPAI